MTLPPQSISPGTAIGGQGSVATGNTASQAQVVAGRDTAAALAKLPPDSMVQASVQSRNGSDIALNTSLGPVTVRLPGNQAAQGDMVWLRVLSGAQGRPGVDAAAALRLQVLSQTLLPAGSNVSGLTGPLPNGSPLIPGQTFQALPGTAFVPHGGLPLPAGRPVNVFFLGPGTIGQARATQIITGQMPGNAPSASLSASSSPATMAGQSPLSQAGGGASIAGMPGSATSPLPGAAPNPAAMPGAVAGNMGHGGPGALPGSTAALPGMAGMAGGAAGGAGANAAPTAGVIVVTGTVLPPDDPANRALPAGYSALKTANGIMGVRLPAPAPVGATLSFGLETTAAKPAIPAMTEAELIARGQNAALTHDWDSLHKAISALTQHDPGAASALLNNIPQPGPKLTATMMLFFGIMNRAGGTARGWIGDRAADSLSRMDDAGGGGILRRLEADFATLHRLMADDRPDGWRVLAMPFHMGERVEQARLAWRRDREDSEKDDRDDPGTRFLLDLSFTQVGHTQLDGLVKGPDNKFDLIIRTENPLQSQNRDDIRGIFRDALQISGYSGHILFQDGSRFVDIAPSSAEPPGRNRPGIEA